MQIQPSRLQAPGIHAMVSGQPWTIPGNQFRRSPSSPLPQLASIQTVFQTSERQSTPHPSPISVTKRAPHTAHSFHHTEYSVSTRSRSPTLELSSDLDSMSSLRVPEAAKMSSGGCFDTENWVGQLVWKYVGHLDLEQLLSFYFHRVDRGTYGKHHTSTRGVPAPIQVDGEAGRRSRGSENHRHEERGRRVRHTYLQREGDECISTDVLDMAQKELPKVKRIIQKMSQDEKARMAIGTDDKVSQQGSDGHATDATARKLGKDDQFTSGVMSQYVAFILISRVYTAFIDSEEENKVLRQDIDQLRRELHDVEQDQHGSRGQPGSPESISEAVYWREQFDKTDCEKQRLEDEVLSLRQQLHQSRLASTAPLIRNLLPPPLTSNKRKRYADCVEEAPSNTPPTPNESDMRHMKRSRTTLEPPKIAIQINGQYRLPPSPSPSCEGSPFSTVSSK